MDGDDAFFIPYRPKEKPRWEAIPGGVRVGGRDFLSGTKWFYQNPKADSTTQARKGKVVTVFTEVPQPVSNVMTEGPGVWVIGWYNDESNRGAFLAVKYLSPYEETNEFGPISP